MRIGLSHFVVVVPIKQFWRTLLFHCQLVEFPKRAKHHNFHSDIDGDHNTNVFRDLADSNYVWCMTHAKRSYSHRTLDNSLLNLSTCTHTSYTRNALVTNEQKRAKDAQKIARVEILLAGLNRHEQVAIFVISTGFDDDRLERTSHLHADWSACKTLQHVD